MADQICYAILCVFSYVAAGQNKTAALVQEQQDPPQTTNAHRISTNQQTSESWRLSWTNELTYLKLTLQCNSQAKWL